MSLPQRSTSRTSSLSKSALKSQKEPARSLLPSPHFEQSPSLTNEDAVEASTTADESVPHFQPFFALIENPSNSEHHHPTVHYIFADDDPEIITEAACRALAQAEQQQHLHSQRDDDDARLPSPVAGAKEHYLVVDIHSTAGGKAYEVTKAHSLSSEWQVLNASITDAPTMDSTAAESGEGLMLKIEGRGAMEQPDSVGSGKKRGRDSLQQLVERFEVGLAEIRKIVDVNQAD